MTEIEDYLSRGMYTPRDELRSLRLPISAEVKIEISVEIEKLFRLCPEKTYIESCLEFAHVYNYDAIDIPKMISATLRKKLEDEAIRANCIRDKKSGKSNLRKWL